MVRAVTEPSVSLDVARTEVERLVATGTPRSEAARRVAAETGLPRRDLYAVRPD